MKKIFALILALSMLSVFAFTVSAATLSVNFATLPMEAAGGQGSGCYPEWQPGGYAEGQPVITFMNYGASVNLGKIDLTQYSSVTISYGQHSGTGKGFGANTFVAISDKAVQGGDSGTVSDAKIYAKLQLETTPLEAVTWKDSEQTATATISTEGFTAGSDVYLAVNLDPTLTNGMSISSITFTGEAGGTGDDGAGDNPNTGDSTVIVIASVAFASLGCAVVLGLRRKHTA